MALGDWFGLGSSKPDPSNTNNSPSTDSPSSFIPDSLPSGNLSSTPTSTLGPLSPISSSSDQSSTAIKQRLTEAIQSQSNLLNAKYLITKINENCFEHCVPDPQASLSSKEKQCLSMCMEKYIEGWNLVSRAYVARLQKEAPGLGVGQSL